MHLISLFKLNGMSLLRSNINIALRNLRKSPVSSLLNLIGLILGVLGSIIIFLTLRFEFSFDRQHENYHELYRVTNNYYYPTFTMYVGNTPVPMAEALRNEFPEFKSVFHFHTENDHNISVGSQIYELDILYCESGFIKGFDYYNNPDNWIIGNPNQTLEEVNKTVLTLSSARRIFGQPEQAIGKIMTLENERQIEVGGIIKDPPANTNYPFEQLISFSTFKDFAPDIFGSVSSTTTFIQIPKRVSTSSLKPALDHFNEKYMEPAWGEDFVSTDLQPLAEVHFDERFGSGSYTTNHGYLWTLGLIGVFMVLIACINFVNLATAKAINRAKEIGVQKILGSSKKHIIIQFMSESFIMGLAAVSLGILLARFSFSYFNELTQLNVGNQFVLNLDLVLFIVGLLLFITLAIGLYPSIVLSNFQPMDVIRNQSIKTPFKGMTIRRGLIGFQLVIAQILVISALVIMYQIRFFQNKDLGFNKESVLVVNLHGDDPVEKKHSLKSQILNLPFVEKASLASSVPLTGHHSSTGLTSPDSEVKERFNAEFIFADQDFVESLNIEFLTALGSIKKPTSDTIVQGIIVNETLIDRFAFGTPDNALGKRVNVNGREASITGVVKNFHTLSLHEAIKPIVIVQGIPDYANLIIRHQTTNIQDAVAQLEQTWKKVFPDKNFDYYFQDESMSTMYENEVRFSQIISVFTIISIFIASIGLIGFSTFTAVRRFKEIGIRKVLGATVSQILFLISKEFIALTLIGFLISIPISYYLIKGWLTGFAYHIEMAWWMIALAGIITLGITLLTVGLQSLKAALISPIDSIRKD